MNNKLALTIDEAAEAGPIGRGKIYQAIANGELQARKCGRRTFILMEDFAEFLRKLPTVEPKSARGSKGEDAA